MRDDREADSPATRTARLSRRRLLRRGLAGLALTGSGVATAPASAKSAESTPTHPATDARTQTAPQFTQQQKLTATDGDRSDLFGESVAVSSDGTTALIGAPGDEDPNGPDAGSAHVFTESGGSWSQQQKLTATDGDSGDRFGASVAVSSDGTTALIGAPRDDDPNGVAAGSAYVFTESGGTWSQQRKLTATDGDGGDFFGVSVAVSSDGTTALIGASNDEDPNGRVAGSGYVFTESGGTWSQQQKLTAPDGDRGDRFGGSVAVLSDGTTALIGAATDEDSNGPDAGSAHVFTESGGSWSQQQKLTATDGDSGDRFGASVAVSSDGTTVLIGALLDEGPNGPNAGSVYVFTESEATWSQQQKLTATDDDPGDRFGESVAVSSDGTTALIGAGEDADPNGRLAGSAYVFTESGGTWSQQQKLTATDGDRFDFFGESVAVSSDGTTALIGASDEEDPNGPNAGSAYVFTDQEAGTVNRFDPAVHGFGFPNYTTPDLPGFGETIAFVEDVVLTELRELTPLDVPQKLTLAGAIYTAQEGGLTNGHCLGMVLTAREYYNTELPELESYTPSTTEKRGVRIQTPPQTAADLVDNPETTPALTPVEVAIDNRQQTQIFDSTHVLRYLAGIFARKNGVGSLNETEVLTAVKQQTDAGKTAPLSLLKTIKSSHVVLAYDVSIPNPPDATAIENATAVTVSVYDPNEPVFDDRQLRFSRLTPDEEFSMEKYQFGSTESQKAIYFEEVDPDYQFFTDGAATDGFGAALSEGLGSFLSVGVMSPVTVSVTRPDGRSLNKVPVSAEELTRQTDTDYEEFHVGLGVSSGEYEIELTGTDTGEYTVEVTGATTDGGQINDSFTEEISAEETQTLTATIPDSSSESGTIEPSTAGPSLSARVQQAGTPGGQARVQYTVSNGSGQASVGLAFTTPSELSVNASASETTGTFGSNAQQLLVFQPDSEVTATVAFEIPASARADATFDIEATVLNEDNTATDTVTTTVGDVETGPVERFDADDDGEISLSEVQAAVRAFSNGELDLQGVQQVIAAFSG